MVQALIRRNFLVGQVQNYWILQGGPQYDIVSVGSHDEIEVIWLPRDEWRPLAIEEGTQIAFLCRTLQEFAVCRRPQDQILGKCFACNEYSSKGWEVVGTGATA